MEPCTGGSGLRYTGWKSPRNKDADLVMEIEAHAPGPPGSDPVSRSLAAAIGPAVEPRRPAAASIEFVAGPVGPGTSVGLALSVGPEESVGPTASAGPVAEFRGPAAASIGPAAIVGGPAAESFSTVAPHGLVGSAGAGVPAGPVGSTAVGVSHGPAIPSGGGSALVVSWNIGRDVRRLDKLTLTQGEKLASSSVTALFLSEVNVTSAKVTEVELSRWAPGSAVFVNAVPIGKGNTGGCRSAQCGPGPCEVGGERTLAMDRSGAGSPISRDQFALPQYIGHLKEGWRS